MPRPSTGRRRAVAPAGVVAFCLCLAAAVPVAADPLRAETRDTARTASEGVSEGPPLALRTNDPETWRVATHPVPPLVMEAEGRLRGFSIDLWNAIARELGVRTAFVRVDDLPALFGAVSDGRADLAIAAVSITAERERRFDFSVTMLETGLRIAVPAAPDATGSATGRALRALLSDATFLQVLLGLAALILAVAALIWWLERRHPGGMAARARPAHGFAHVLWWALSSLAAQAEEMPRSPLARAITVVWLFTCIALVAWFTAGLTSTATVERLRGAINGPQDLPGKRVGTVAHTTSVAYLADHFATPVGFASLEEACAALQAGTVAAVVYDAPALSYYATQPGHAPLRLIGPAFNRQAYGILFAANDPRRKRVNQALLGLREDGRYDEIYSRWFGSESGEAQDR
ncbi:ABC transporter substrate-binding protein [Methylobacterium sp. XJLW]|uniref:transporter substrate-binding domain-containing protein n=1 Tax=Methylobacterium sp. XJLW TaxID=739141 RepID=UPI000DAAFBE2|nr:transporter substrate-binding domain-containing protein [Methylobacterium sp. XJLW]AWV15833.1 ABC transporter substrate-binding protein [Methylobacterium sp. XJLW]